MARMRHTLERVPRAVAALVQALTTRPTAPDGVKPVVVPIVPPAQHLAEKLHAYSRRFEDDVDSATGITERIRGRPAATVLV